MEFILYIFFISLSLIFIFLGFFLNGKADVFKILGYVFLLLLSLMIIPGTPGDLSYKTGFIETYTYDNGTIDSIETNYTYSQYESHTFGVYLSLAAIFGFIEIHYSRKGDRS